MKIFLSSKVDRQLSKLPRKMHDLIVSRIEKLGKTPMPPGSKKLAGRQVWRIRIGDYRVLYTVDSKNKDVIILSVRHRKDIYRY